MVSDQPADESTPDNPESMTHAERAFALLQNPHRFRDLQHEDESDKMYFLNLSRKAANEMSFDEWVNFLDVFFDHADDAAKIDFEGDLARHAKNMVLGTGARGSNFRVESLANLAKKMEAYSSAGLEVPNLDQIVVVILEHTYDREDDPVFIRGVCETLLSTVPDDGSQFLTEGNDVEDGSLDSWSPLEKAVDLLTRASVTARLQLSDSSSDALPDVADEYVEKTFSPTINGTPAEEATGTEHIHESKNLPYEDINKARRCAAALHADGDPMVLVSYLYLTGQNIVETYRHGGSLSRGQMLLAEHQLNAISGFNAPPTEPKEEWPNYVRSYTALSIAIERTGGSFTSDRENRPERADIEAAEAYTEAAEAIHPVNPERGIKYWSKAFRSTAGMENDPGTNIALHESALAYFLRLMKTADGGVREVLEETINFHRFALARSKALQAYVRRDPETFRTEYHEAMDLLDDVPQSDLDISDLDYRIDVMRAREYELESEFDQAVEAYRLVDATNDGLKNRRHLCRVKQAVAEDNYELAREHLRRHFTEPQLLEAVITTLSGGTPSPIDTDDPLNVPLAAVDTATATALAWSIRIARVSEDLPDAYAEAIRERFYKL